MSPVIFGNPVRGEVHPRGWVQPPRNREFRVTQRFGCTGFKAERPFGDCDHFHRAIDLGNHRSGDDVLAANAGRVHSSGQIAGGNIVVVLDHGGGWFTVYGHLSKKTVATGEEVGRGKKIGEVGATGNATGAHLHFAVKSDAKRRLSILGDLNGKWHNPWPLLAQNVTIHPLTTIDKVRIRDGSSMEAAVFARTNAAGRIIRAADDADLGPATAACRWGGTVTGGAYELFGRPGTTWDRIFIDGAFRFIAEPLAVRSAS